jgi:hypothetical protein
MSVILAEAGIQHICKHMLDSRLRESGDFWSFSIASADYPTVERILQLMFYS